MWNIQVLVVCSEKTSLETVKYKTKEVFLSSAIHWVLHSLPSVHMLYVTTEELVVDFSRSNFSISGTKLYIYIFFLFNE